MKNLNSLSADIRKAMEAVASKHGLAVKFCGGTYGDTSYSVKFEFAETRDDGIVLDEAAERWRRDASMFGFDPNDLGKVIVITDRHGDADEYQITGLNARSRKYPVETVRVRDGSPIRWNVRWVQRAMRESAATTKLAEPLAITFDI